MTNSSTSWTETIYQGGKFALWHVGIPLAAAWAVSAYETPKSVYAGTSYIGPINIPEDGLISLADLLKPHGVSVDFYKLVYTPFPLHLLATFALWHAPGALLEHLCSSVDHLGIWAIKPLYTIGAGFDQLSALDVFRIVQTLGVESIEPLQDAEVNFEQLKDWQIISLLHELGKEAIIPLHNTGVHISEAACCEHNTDHLVVEF